MTFKKAIGQTPTVAAAWKPGLQALRAQDKPHVKPENTRCLGGSADIDTALQKREPNANRWDFAIAYRHTNHPKEFIYWVETHTGSDDQVKVVLKKLEWLKRWLRQDGRLLNQFDRNIVWVSSGHTYFTKGSIQVKLLAQQGLIYSGATLRIPNKRRTP